MELSPLAEDPHKVIRDANAYAQNLLITGHPRAAELIRKLVRLVQSPPASALATHVRTVPELGAVAPAKATDYDPPLDQGIARAVEILNAAGIETYESCQGGPGHAMAEPTVRFHGDKSEGLKALDVALKNGLPVRSLRRFWTLIDNEPVGPKWELVFTSQISRG